MANLAALRAAVFSISAKNCTGGVEINPPAGARARRRLRLRVPTPAPAPAAAGGEARKGTAAADRDGLEGGHSIAEAVLAHLATNHSLSTLTARTKCT